MDYRAPWWLPGGQAQTVWPALYARRHLSPQPQALRRERWTTPDGDFVDVDHLDGSTPDAPLLVLFHGLEGSAQSAYAQAFADVAARRGWAFALPHFRGCSGESNLAPRSYHSGDFEEVGWMLARLRAQHRGPMVAAGVSLGGNALLRWAQESGELAARTVSAVSSICSPIDLAACGHALARGFNRQVYTRMFLRTLIPKALDKLAQHPGLFDAERLRSARDLYEFDNVYTAPLHGYRDTEDYWARASAKPHLHRLRLPALVLNARNDPFVPAHCLPTPEAVQNDWVQLWQPAQGGHVGFPSGGPPGNVLSMPTQVCDWLAQAASLPAANAARSTLSMQPLTATPASATCPEAPHG